MLKADAKRRGLKSERGILRDLPFMRFMANSPIPPSDRQRVRNVHGESSPKTTFIAGKLSPQNSVRAARRIKPRRGRWSGFSVFNQRSPDVVALKIVMIWNTHFRSIWLNRHNSLFGAGCTQILSIMTCQLGISQDHLQADTQKASKGI